MKKYIFISLCLVLSVFLLTCCADSAVLPTKTAPQSEHAAPPQTGERYVAISCMSSYEYFTDHRIGFTKACQELGVQYEYLAPMENDIEAMKEYFRYAIDQKVDGIVVFGGSEELGEMIDLAWEKGIPCVTIDGDIENSKRIAFVGTDKARAGEMGAKIAVREMGTKGNVAILTELEVDLHKERTRGAQQYFEQYPEIQVIRTVDTGASTDTAYQAAVDLLRHHPETDLVLCTDYFGGAAAAAAVEELGMVGKIKIIAMDRNSYVLKKIEEGVISATLVQQTALMPYYAMMILYHYNNPPVSIVPDRQSAGITGVPAYVDTGIFVIDKDNYEYFTRN